jgi:hypothetical protein
MSKNPYKIVNAKPSWASKLASGTVALGSVATAIVITVPGLPGYEALNQASGAVDQQQTESTGLAPLNSQASVSTPSDLPADLAANVVDPTTQQTLGSQVLASSLQIGTNSTVLTLPGITAGNTSSPTPYGSSSGAYEDDEDEDEDEYEDEYENEDEDDEEGDEDDD